jgi:glutaminyl-tRNA synthetase
MTPVTPSLPPSLEHVDYSICTLEFESRRESYFWLLEALDLYRPKVYEMSRLNIAYTVLSKRKLLKLVTAGVMSGWDDPRMPTIKGLRRRGYTREILNSFCTDIGVTRNENIVEYERLASV